MAFFKRHAHWHGKFQQLRVTIMHQSNTSLRATISQRPAPACLTFMHKAINPIILDVLSKREVSTS